MGRGEGEGHKWFLAAEKKKLLRRQTDVDCKSCRVNILERRSDNFCRRCGDIYTPAEMQSNVVVACHCCTWVWHRECLYPAIPPHDDIGAKTAGLFACSPLCVDDVEKHLICVNSKKTSRKRKRC